MQPVWPVVWRVCYHWTDDWLLQSPHFCAAFTAIKFRQSLSVWVIGLCHFFPPNPHPQGCTSGPVKNGNYFIYVLNVMLRNLNLRNGNLPKDIASFDFSRGGVGVKGYGEVRDFSLAKSPLDRNTGAGGLWCSAQCVFDSPPIPPTHGGRGSRVLL
ncbi:hypothetical protein CDAR_289821 [Caerostris darwini]|uniref:Uncharacterized protein n=1 Tax=Caerostris darwini TaxID=1538125 RepID=A0AAV4WVI2_9ARAC|nr:hypothetical protein CDAR_289821 [Caerostris darwini]